LDAGSGPKTVPDAREQIDAIFAAPSYEHLDEVMAQGNAAIEVWRNVNAERLAAAERIADAVIFNDAIDPNDLDVYCALHADQAAARHRILAALCEAQRALPLATTELDRKGPL